MRKILKSLILAFFLLVSAIFARYPSSRAYLPYNSQTDKYLQKNIERTAKAYAFSKSINAVVSVVQESEISGSVVIASASTSPGELLDPLNDLAEKFSNLMLICFAILGIEKILFNLFQFFGFSLLSISLLGLIGSIYLGFLSEWIDVYLKFIGIAFIVIVILPFQAVSAQLISNYFLTSDYKQARASLEKDSNTMLEKRNGSDGTWLSFKDMSSIKPSEKFRELRDKASDYYTKFLNLIVIFTLEAIILPILALYVGVKLIFVFTGRNKYIVRMSSQIRDRI